MSRSKSGRDASRRTGEGGAAPSPDPVDNGDWELIDSGAIDPDVTTTYIELINAGATVFTLDVGTEDGQLKTITNDAFNEAATSARINATGGIRRGNSGGGGSGYVQILTPDTAAWFGSFCVLRWSADANMWLFQYGVGWRWQEES